MLEKVISGGQTGADIGGLRAAKKCGIATGGWLPKGCVTLEGNKPNLLNEFNMQEHSVFGYPARTEANVRDSDATIRLAENFKSAGEICTFKFIKWHKKPYLDVNIKKLISIEEVVKWLYDKNVKILNIAGNSESTCPGIESIVETYLENVFIQYKQFNT